MNLGQFLTFWGCFGMFFGAIAWFGTWVSCHKVVYWRWVFIVSLVATMVGSIL